MERSTIGRHRRELSKPLPGRQFARGGGGRWACGLCFKGFARAVASSWSCALTLKVLPVVLAVHRVRSGQSTQRDPKVAAPPAEMVTVRPLGQVTVRAV